MRVIFTRIYLLLPPPPRLQSLLLLLVYLPASDQLAVKAVLGISIQVSLKI